MLSAYYPNPTPTATPTPTPNPTPTPYPNPYPNPNVPLGGEGADVVGVLRAGEGVRLGVLAQLDRARALGLVRGLRGWGLWGLWGLGLGG